MAQIVADLGNSRLKVARLMGNGVEPARAAPFESSASWQSWLDADRLLLPDDSWAVVSVNPPVAEVLARMLSDRGVRDVRWFRSAGDVEVPHRLPQPETTGADRALAVLAAREWGQIGRAGLVVLCGTAITVESIDAQGTWLGGSIAAGLPTIAGALASGTAQLPRIDLEPAHEPPVLGTDTQSAIRSGLYWGLVGSVKERIARQSALFRAHGEPWILWTGGDADWLARAVEGPTARVVPDLVLLGLARAAFGAVRQNP